MAKKTTPKPRGLKKIQRRYTISTYTFKSLEAAKKQILKFEENEGYNGKSKIFEVVGTYDIEIKKVVSLKKQKPKAEEDPLTLY